MHIFYNQDWLQTEYIMISSIFKTKHTASLSHSLNPNGLANTGMAEKRFLLLSLFFLREANTRQPLNM